MFSGIVEESAIVRRIEGASALKSIYIESELDHRDTKIGDSICIDGVCLTLTKKENKILRFDTSPETLRRSTLGSLRAGGKVNLERSLILGGRIHGHLVFGHVDCVIPLISRRHDGESLRLEWRVPTDMRKYLTPKGSVSISGVSLTIGEATKNSFSVYAIPHTLSVTTLSNMQVGQNANLEVDMLARYVQAGLNTNISS